MLNERTKRALEFSHINESDLLTCPISVSFFKSNYVLRIHFYIIFKNLLSF